MTPTYDTLIIGAGIAGASLGYRLAGQQRVPVSYTHLRAHET